MAARTPNTRDEQDSAYSPGELHAQEQFGNTNVAESDQQDSYDKAFNDLTNDDNYSKSADPSQENENIENARQQENDGNDLNFTGSSAANPSSSGSGAATIKGLAKKGGPVGLVVGLLLGAAGLVSFFGGPGLLIVNVAEVITEKFNFQLGSMDVRTTRIMKAKFENSTTGVCSSVVSIRCKFVTFSDKEVERFKKAGIDFEGDKKTIFGRTKPTGMTFTDASGKRVTIKPAEFSRTLRANPVFARAVTAGFNPKFAGFADNVWNKYAKKLRISKAAPFSESDNTNEKRQKKLQDTTKNGDQSGRVTTSDGKDCSKPNTCTPQEEENARRKNGAASQIQDTAETAAKNNLKNTTNVFRQGANSAANVVKITGIADTACNVFTMIDAVSQGAKLIRGVQMARFAMVFLSTASMIKAGDARAEDVSYLGDLLTKTYRLPDGTTTKTATDSFGYRYAAFGDAGMDDGAMQYMAGGGLGGELSKVTTGMIALLGGKPSTARETCGILGNPFVQAGSLAVGLAVWLIPGGGQAISGTRVAVQVGIGLITFAAMAVLPSMIADLIAGNLVDKNTVGEQAGNAFVSGSGYMMSGLAAAGGNAPLTPEQAVAYTKFNDSVIAKYSDTSNQFDATNPNTFLGALYTRMAPYISSMRNVSSFASAPLKLTSTATSSLVNTSVGAAPDDYRRCQDVDIREADIAADEFCNIVRGIPQQYLNDDPLAVISRISRDINQETGAPESGAYKDFIAECIDRSKEVVDTKNCVIDNQKKADWYVYYVDIRIQDGMENDFPKPEDGLGNSQTNDQTTENNVAGSINDFAWPVDKKYWDKNKTVFTKGHTLISGTFTSPYARGMASDIGSSVVPTGSPVYSMTDGRVIRTSLCGSGDGMMIESKIQGGTMQIAYGHGINPKFKVGDTVKKGDQILSLAGRGCKVFGDHLHVDMTYNSKHICPQDIFIALGRNQDPSLQALTGRANSGCTGRSF